MKLCDRCGVDIATNNYNRHLIICKNKENTFPYPTVYPLKSKNVGSCVTLSSEIHKFHIPRKHTEDTKNKISLKRIEFLDNNPDKVPYKLNHSSKESYPERYFKQILNKYKIIFEREYQISLYSLDFALHSKKIDLEIDGEQHYVDSKIIESDIRRTKKLTELGWTVIRVRWAHYKKLELIDRQKFILDLLDRLN